MDFDALMEKVKEQDIDKPIDDLVAEINKACLYGDINRKETSDLLSAIMERVKE